MRSAMTAHHGDRFVDLGSLGVVEAGDVAFDHGNQVPDPADLLLGGGGVGARPLVDAVDGRGQSFPGAQQVLEIGLQVGQERDIGLEVVAAGQRNRIGQAPPPAWTLEGSLQVPYGTATCPIACRARSESSRARASRQMRLPCRSKLNAVTLLTASRRRSSPIL